MGTRLYVDGVVGGAAPFSPSTAQAPPTNNTPPRTAAFTAVYEGSGAGNSAAELPFSPPNTAAAPRGDGVRVDSLTASAEWFVSGVERPQVKEFTENIMEHGEIGDFLIRDVSSDPENYGLAIKTATGLSNYLIERIKSPGRTNQFRLKGESAELTFMTVAELVYHYATSAGGVRGTKLKLQEDDLAAYQEAVRAGDSPWVASVDPETSSAHWFKAGLPRERVKQVTAELMKAGPPGAFFIRDVASQPGTFAFVLKNGQGEMKNILIERVHDVESKSMGYQLAGAPATENFPSLYALVAHYASSPHGVLGTVINPGAVFSTADSGGGGAQLNAPPAGPMLASLNTEASNSLVDTTAFSPAPPIQSTPNQSGAMSPRFERSVRSPQASRPTSQVGSHPAAHRSRPPSHHSHYSHQPQPSHHTPQHYSQGQQRYSQGSAHSAMNITGMSPEQIAEQLAVLRARKQHTERLVRAEEAKLRGLLAEQASHRHRLADEVNALRGLRDVKSTLGQVAMSEHAEARHLQKTRSKVAEAVHSAGTMVETLTFAENKLRLQVEHGNNIFAAVQHKRNQNTEVSQRVLTELEEVQEAQSVTWKELEKHRRQLSDLQNKRQKGLSKLAQLEELATEVRGRTQGVVAEGKHADDSANRVVHREGDLQSRLAQEERKLRDLLASERKAREHDRLLRTADNEADAISRGRQLADAEKKTRDDARKAVLESATAEGQAQYAAEREAKRITKGRQNAAARVEREVKRSTHKRDSLKGLNVNPVTGRSSRKLKQPRSPGPGGLKHVTHDRQYRPSVTSGGSDSDSEDDEDFGFDPEDLNDFENMDGEGTTVVRAGGLPFDLDDFVNLYVGSGNPQTGRGSSSHQASSKGSKGGSARINFLDLNSFDNIDDEDTAFTGLYGRETRGTAVKPMAVTVARAARSSNNALLAPTKVPNARGVRFSVEESTNNDDIEPSETEKERRKKLRTSKWKKKTPVDVEVKSENRFANIKTMWGLREVSLQIPAVLPICPLLFFGRVRRGILTALVVFWRFPDVVGVVVRACSKALMQECCKPMHVYGP